MADTAPAGPQHDDTVKMPAVPAVLWRRSTPTSSTPRNSRSLDLSRFRLLRRKALWIPGAGRPALVALLIGALLFAASRDRGATAQSVPTVTTSATATVSHQAGPRRRVDHSVGGFARLCQALRNGSNPRYVPWWRRYFSAGAALGGWQVAGLSVTHQDRPVGPVHCLYRARAAGSLSASRDRPDFRRDVENLCAGHQGLTASVARRDW